MHKIIYFKKRGTGFDMIRAEKYRTEESLILEPYDECLVILLNSHQRAVKFDQLFFRGHEFIISNKKPHQLCVLLRNMSSSLSFQIRPGYTLKKVIEKSYIAYKLCHIKQKDMFRAEIVSKNYHNRDNSSSSNSSNSSDHITDFSDKDE